MGNRVTCAATHLPENAVNARMQGEQRPWCRQHWEVIYQALIAPRKAEDIARTVGVSASTVHLVLVPAMLRPLRANVLKRTGFPCRSVKKWSTPKASSGLSSRWYPSDLTDQEWARLSPLIPPAKEGGRPRTTDMRDVLNAIFYVDRTGCQWRALPHDFPPWSRLCCKKSVWNATSVTGRPLAQFRLPFQRGGR